MNGIEELITRLEKATGPDRELDGEIALAVGWDRMDAWAFSVVYWIAPDDTKHEQPPLYTESINAALTLVPEGWAWFVQHVGGDFSKGDARLWIPSRRTQGLKCEQADAHLAASPAIALCIAALKARAALSNASGAS